jgi:hypothetical protein
MKQTLRRVLAVFFILIILTQPVFAQPVDSVEDTPAPVPAAVDKSGQGLMWLIGIPMAILSIPAGVFGQIGSALDNFSADTANEPVPAARGIGAAPKEATQIPDDNPNKGA